MSNKLVVEKAWVDGTGFFYIGVREVERGIPTDVIAFCCGLLLGLIPFLVWRLS